MTGRSQRARAVRALAHELTQRAGVLVEADFQGPGTDPWSGWHLRWSGGPPRTQMRSIAVEIDATRPGPARVLDAVRFDRSLADEQAATAMLAWMAQHPDNAAGALMRDDGELPGYPEREPAAIRRRAATLIAAGWRAHTAGDAARELASRAQSGGWPQVCTWLDALGAEQDAPVLPLERPSPTPPDQQ